MALNSMSVAAPQKGGGSNKIFFILGGIVALAFIVYVGLSLFAPSASQEGKVVSNTSGSVDKATQDEVAQNAQALNQDAEDIIKAVNLINTVRIDSEFLKDKRFLELRQTPIDIPDPQQPSRRVFELYKAPASTASAVPTVSLPLTNPQTSKKSTTKN